MKALACRRKIFKKRKQKDNTEKEFYALIRNVHSKMGKLGGKKHFLTVYFIQWNLAKYLKVGTIKHPSEYPFRLAVVGMKQSLGCHTVGNEPHAQEKQKEENIFHLKKTREEEKRRGNCSVSCC